MRGGDTAGAGTRAVIYCLVPRELARKLHEPLRRHFQDNADVEVVVKRRGHERRASADRRLAQQIEHPDDRRLVRNPAGRRVGDRRSPAVAVDAPPLPRKARPHAERLTFVERLEPSSERLEDLDTARLITRIQAGDRDLFATLYMRYFDRVYSYLKVVFKQDEDAEDGAQQVFIKVLEALPEYEQRGRPFRAWLFTIVRNYALGQLRKDDRCESLDAQPAAVRESRTGSEDELRALSWISDRELVMFFERLPLAQRQVLLLRFVMGLSVAETGEVLGRTQEGVRKLQSRGLTFLRQRLRAVGRAPERDETGRSRRYGRQARVLRARRFALIAPGGAR